MSGLVLWITVALIGGVGALARVALADTIALRARHGELGVALVNVSGAFLLGVLFGHARRTHRSPARRQRAARLVHDVLGLGACGA